MKQSQRTLSDYVSEQNARLKWWLSERVDGPARMKKHATLCEMPEMKYAFIEKY